MAASSYCKDENKAQNLQGSEGSFSKKFSKLFLKNQTILFRKVRVSGKSRLVGIPENVTGIS